MSKHSEWETLYFRLFGDDHHDPDSAVILALIGLTEGDIVRFRGAWWTDEGRIVVLTRTGGNNREFTANTALTTNPYYLYDADDEDDPTYAKYYFSVPAEIAEDVKQMRTTLTASMPERLPAWLERRMRTIARKGERHD